MSKLDNIRHWIGFNQVSIRYYILLIFIIFLLYDISYHSEKHSKHTLAQSVDVAGIT